MKKTYTTPQLTVHGDVEKVTQQNVNRTFPDRRGGTRRTALSS